VTRVGDIEVVLDERFELGEGPTWDAARAELAWVDLLAGRVHVWEPASGRRASFDVGQPVGAVVPRASGGFVLALAEGFAGLDPIDGRVEPLAAVEADNPRNRMNDGKCDSAGRFWAGTMEYGGEPGAGSLYRLGPDGRVIRIVGGVSISNGIAWSPDDETMYFIDSAAHAIDAFDFDPATGEAMRRRRLVSFPAAWGLPDGMTIDVDGFLWVAFWDGRSVRRLAPDGRLDEIVELPATRVTSCVFGGPDLTDLYVTSAMNGLTPEQLASEPEAGALFRVRPGVRGLPQHPFGG